MRIETLISIIKTLISIIKIKKAVTNGGERRKV